MAPCITQSIPWGEGPLSLYSGLQKDDHAFCLYSSGRGRFSYLGSNPLIWLAIYPSGIESSWGSKVKENFFQWFKNKFPSPVDLSPSPFFGSGWVGFFAYEMASFANDALPFRKLPPDFLLGWWGLYDPIFVFDHHEKKAWIASWGLDENFRPDEKRARERVARAAYCRTGPVASASPSGSRPALRDCDPMGGPLPRATRLMPFLW